jgi:hypothetical protein
VKTAEVWGDRYQNAAFTDENSQQITNRNALKQPDMKLIDAGYWKRKLFRFSGSFHILNHIQHLMD